MLRVGAWDGGSVRWGVGVCIGCIGYRISGDGSKRRVCAEVSMSARCWLGALFC